MRTVSVLGAGSWGTALAVHLGGVGHDVRLWARDRALVDDMRARRVNATYLPDITLPDSVSITATLIDALRGSELVVLAIPSHGLRAVAHEAAAALARGTVLVSATKGLESVTLLRMSEVVAQEAGSGHPVVVLSGPSFALEVARQQPTAVLAASVHVAAMELVQAEFRGPSLRLYGSDDVVGVEIGGALKNTIAIAAGVVEGLGLGCTWGRSGKNRPLPRSGHAGGADCREGMLRQEGLCPVYALCSRYSRKGFSMRTPSISKPS
jgi:glycerol-3-phosphate dehydrogenase (NAD(P)+)